VAITGELMHNLSDGIRSSHSSDGGTILDIRQGRMFSLNYVGSRIFEHAKNGLREYEIVDKIRSEFAIPSNVADADVREFLELLQTHGLLT
jgi:hypothetical protein